jgi:protein-S-isoprenylcysteine O-methyltransferase Ste14
LVFLVIPLIGWGLADMPGFFSRPQRLAYALIIESLAVAVCIQSIRAPEGIQGGKGREDARIPRQTIIRIVVVFMLYAVLMFLPYADRRGIGVLSGQQSFRWLGVILLSAGLWLIYWSGIALGRLYSGDVTLQENHMLVTDGPYTHIRHPRYTGGILQAFGLALIYNSWIGLVVSLLFIGIILVRIYDEEILMANAFGQEWEDYCKLTYRLIPHVF